MGITYFLIDQHARYIARSTAGGVTVSHSLSNKGRRIHPSRMFFRRFAVDKGGKPDVVFSDGVETQYLTNLANQGATWVARGSVNNGRHSDCDSTLGGAGDPGQR